MMMAFIQSGTARLSYGRASKMAATMVNNRFISKLDYILI
jgi:hypothetical protein